jgi:hypothetical protein
VTKAAKRIGLALLGARIGAAFTLFGLLPREPSKAQVGDMVTCYVILSILFGIVAWLLCPPECDQCAANRCPQHREGRPGGDGDFSEL